MTAREGGAFILVDPFPRVEDMIFTGASRARLEAVAELVCYWGAGRMPPEGVERWLPRADVVIGQTHLDAGRIERAEAGAFRLAVDVFPEEPVPAKSTIRASRQALFSAHRAGGIRASYERIATWLADDVEQVLQGFAPMRLQRAEPALAAKMRSR